MGDEEKRRHPRVATQQTVWVEGQDVRVAAEARNMSKGGMFVVAEPDAPAVGSTLQVKFDDPQEGEVDLRMEVVWREESTVNAKLGLRVLDSKGMEAFERVVSRHAAASFRSSAPARPSTGERDSRQAPPKSADALANTEPPPAAGTPSGAPDVDK